MYDYHNELTRAHAASSPWWAWPFDLKPVWFYQESFAGGTAAAIYDAGNLVIWWLGSRRMAFVRVAGVQAAEPGAGPDRGRVRRPVDAWARIDRAAFQYHYYTACRSWSCRPRLLHAEIWHGASRGRGC